MTVIFRSDFGKNKSRQHMKRFYEGEGIILMFYPKIVAKDNYKN